MIRKIISNKSALLASALIVSHLVALATILIVGNIFVGGDVHAESVNDDFCKNLPHSKAFMTEEPLPFMEGNPFIEIDFPATINKLPKGKKQKANRLYKELDRKYQVLDKAEQSFDFDEATGLMEIEDELDSIICSSGVELVTVNLLDKLPGDKRKRAEMLWKDIQSQSGDIDKKWDELYSIIDSVKTI